MGTPSTSRTSLTATGTPGERPPAAPPASSARRARRARSQRALGGHVQERVRCFGSSRGDAVEVRARRPPRPRLARGRRAARSRPRPAAQSVAHPARTRGTRKRPSAASGAAARASLAREAGSRHVLAEHAGRDARGSWARRPRCRATGSTRRRPGPRRAGARTSRAPRRQRQVRQAGDVLDGLDRDAWHEATTIPRAVLLTALRTRLRLPRIDPRDSSSISGASAEDRARQRSR